MFLINTVLDECKKLGAEVGVIHASDAVNSAKQPFCVNCSSPCSKVCYEGTYCEEAIEEIKSADALIFASPVYFGGPTAQIKALFDKMRDVRAKKALIGVPCGFIAVGASRFGGQEATITALHNVALIQGVSLVGTGHAEFDAGHLGVSAQAPAKSDEFAISRCISLAHRLCDK